MTDLVPVPCPHSGQALKLILSAARRQALADCATTEAERDRHDISAAMLRMAAGRAAALVSEPDDG